MPSRMALLPPAFNENTRIALTSATAGKLWDGGFAVAEHRGLFAPQRSVRVEWDLQGTSSCTRRGADEVGEHTWEFR